jgi:DNA-binding transcriptional LysR family regulator
MSVTVDKLRYFVVLADELNFTRAASRVFMTQQAFSAHIRQLESWVGAPLFERSPRGVELTPAGAQLIGYVREALAALDAGLDEVRALGGTQRLLRIGGTPYGAGELIFVVLDQFRAEHPGFVLEMWETRFEDPTSGLRDGLVDLAFVRPPIDTSGLIVRALFDEPIVLCVSSRHPFAELPAVTLEQALAEPLVVARKTTPEWDDFWLLCRQRGGRPRVGATAGSIVEELETVAAGSAATFFPASGARLHPHHGIRYLPIVDGPVTTVALAWRDKGLSAAARAFIDVVDHVMATEVEVMDALRAGKAPG